MTAEDKLADKHLAELATLPKEDALQIQRALERENPPPYARRGRNRYFQMIETHRPARKGKAA